jgi:cation diffusion facilitator family transporter
MNQPRTLDHPARVNRPNAEYLQTVTRRGLLVTFVALLVNLLLSIIKLVAGWVGGSYALVADGVESCADVLGSLVVLGGMKIAAKPADENHPYGHGRAETLAALFVTILLLLAGLGIGVKAVQAIVNPSGIPAPFTLWVLLGVIVVKEVLFRRMRRSASLLDSAAILSDAWHHRCDAITSAAAVAGISIALLGGPAFQSADAWAALIASAVIVVNAARLARKPIGELMEVEPTELIERVRQVAAGTKGVHRIEKIQARKSGLCYWLDMHVEVDPNMTVRQGHDLAHEVQDSVCQHFPQIAGAIIHIEPGGEGVA